MKFINKYAEWCEIMDALDGIERDQPEIRAILEKAAKAIEEELKILHEEELKMNYFNYLSEQYRYVIRINNKKTGEILEQGFISDTDAEIYENMLNFCGTEYEVYSRESTKNWERIQ